MSESTHSQDDYEVLKCSVLMGIHFLRITIFTLYSCWIFYPNLFWTDT